MSRWVQAVLAVQRLRGLAGTDIDVRRNLQSEALAVRAHQPLHRTDHDRVGQELLRRT